MAMKHGEELQDDRPQQANESGEQKETSRSHGRIINENGTPAGAPGEQQTEAPQDWESGRHQAD